MFACDNEPLVVKLVSNMEVTCIIQALELIHKVQSSLLQFGWREAWSVFAIIPEFKYFFF